MTIACIGAIIESVMRGWEFWVTPLIIGGLIASWWFHITLYGRPAFRENFYMVFSMMVAFFYGVHKTSFYDIIVVSTLLMVTATLLKRSELLIAILIEYFALIGMQVFIVIKTDENAFDSHEISRLILHIACEICICKILKEILKNGSKTEKELNGKNQEEEKGRIEMEDFLVNISHELRTPVNVINGMTSLILKKESREDVCSIQDAGKRLSHQIEDIQDYSEIQRGDVVLEEDRYEINSILNDITLQYAMSETYRNLELIVDLDPNLPSVLRGDSKKLAKIISHLLDNAFKFTSKGGVYLHIYGIKKEYGINLIIEVRDTGIGMSQTAIEKISKGRYQANQKRNRSTGGIGLGLSIVYGFVRLMKGFVTIDSERGRGTSVRISLVQEVLNATPCLSVEGKENLTIAFYLTPERFRITELREFYNVMAANMAAGLKVNLYPAMSLKELEKLLDQEPVSHIFMGPEEYEQNTSYFDELANKGITIAVSAHTGFKVSDSSKVIVMPKPIYGYQVAKILNGETDYADLIPGVDERRPVLDGVRTLIVDDEPMNLVVATGLFKEYNMIIDTALSGKEAIKKYEETDYDVIFMDHMMPEMDGVEAMKQLKKLAAKDGRVIRIIALTANALSGAREMFLNEGFDGFIAKPINIKDFERVMNRIFPNGTSEKTGGV